MCILRNNTQWNFAIRSNGVAVVWISLSEPYIIWF